MDQKTEMLETADLFVRYEQLLAQAYELCAEKIPAHKASWEILRKNEEEHAHIFAEIRQAIAAKPEGWTHGKLSPQALRLSIDTLQTRLKEFREGKINQNYFLNFLMDCEQSLLESEITKSFHADGNPAAAGLSKVQSETVNHKQLLRSLIEKR